jgi:hypothetical protein
MACSTYASETLTCVGVTLLSGGGVVLLSGGGVVLLSGGGVMLLSGGVVPPPQSVPGRQLLPQPAKVAISSDAAKRLNILFFGI